MFGTPARSGTRSAVRVGVRLAFAAPFLYFIAQYIWINDTTHGLVPALVSGVIEGLLNTLSMAIKHPLQSSVYLVVTTLLWRWAWRH